MNGIERSDDLKQLFLVGIPGRQLADDRRDVPLEVGSIHGAGRSGDLADVLAYEVVVVLEHLVA